VPEAMKPASMKGKAALSYWVDESIPERAIAVLSKAGLDASEFARRLGPSLGVYRGRKHVEGALPARSEEADYALRLRKMIGDVELLLDSGAMPPRLHAGLLGELHRRKINWIEMRSGLLRDLRLLEIMLSRAEKDLRATRGRVGRKPKEARAHLIDAISAEIARQCPEWGKARTARTALSIVVACGVEAPGIGDDDRPDKTVKRATLAKGRK
jgi:hypothetical protein